MLEYLVPPDANFGFVDSATTHEAMFAELDKQFRNVFCEAHRSRPSTNLNDQGELVVRYCCEAILPHVERVVRNGRKI